MARAWPEPSWTYALLFPTAYSVSLSWLLQEMVGWYPRCTTGMVRNNSTLYCLDTSLFTLPRIQAFNYKPHLLLTSLLSDAMVELSHPGLIEMTSSGGPTREAQNSKCPYALSQLIAKSWPPLYLFGPRRFIVPGDFAWRLAAVGTAK